MCDSLRKQEVEMVSATCFPTLHDLATTRLPYFEPLATFVANCYCYNAVLCHHSDRSDLLVNDFRLLSERLIR